jgi:hypothetical protein
MLVEPLRSTRQVLDLQARLTIQIVAYVAGLKIQVDYANLALLRLFLFFELGR